jgi:hypothetical protein
VVEVSSLADPLWVLSGSNDTQCLQKARQLMRSVRASRPELAAHAV